jgi:hypothetical protein
MYNLLFKMKKFCCLFAIMTCSSIVFSQTTINYLTSGLSTSACNVFDFNQTINGVVHTSYAGGVKFSTSSGLLLDVQDKTTPFSGTGSI